MDGRTFEEFLGTVFRRLGYRVENTRYRGDYGADLVIAKDGFKTAVQAKRWSKRVGVKAVQEAVASAGYYNCHRALVVANRKVTRQARELAGANNVELWDRETLVAKLLAVRGRSEAPPAVLATPPAAVTRVLEPLSAVGSASAQCATCGVVVSDKVRHYCLARPQRFSGSIYCFAHQRGVRSALAPSE
jgi:restriction system protein